MKALVLTDGKAGHENQSKALARALGLEVEIKEIHFRSKLHKALSYLLDQVGVRTATWLFDQEILLSDIALVIGTGSGTFYAAKAFARKWKAKCAVVLYPRAYHIGSFDCVLAPAFDNPKAALNVIKIPANLVANDEEFYAKGIKNFESKTKVKPDIAVIIGGPNKCSTMTKTWMKAQLDEIFKLEGAKAVTTSRRTPKDVEELVDSYPWDYKLIYSVDHFNPIPAFVKTAKKLYVTAESTGMLSEACTFGSAKVIALDNLKAGNHKFRRFVEALKESGYLNGSRKIDLSSEMASVRRLLSL